MKPGAEPTRKDMERLDNIDKELRRFQKMFEAQIKP